MTTTVATPGGTSPGRRVQVGLLLQRQGALIALVVLVLFGVFRYGGVRHRLQPEQPHR